MSTSVHLLAPAGFGGRPSGGNVYDRRVQAGLVGLGWEVVTHEVGRHRALPDLPPGSLALVDSLVASWAAEQLLAVEGVRWVPLVHMVFGTAGEAELLASAPVVVVTSDWTRRRLVERHGLDPERVHVAVPGVAMADPVPGSDAGAELLCVAPVVRAKGHYVLLAALARLTDLDWRCTLVGATDHEPDFVDALRKAAADAGMGERVELVGEVAHDDVCSAYARADLLVLPSRAETYGMVVTEALAHGLPVVAAAVGGVPEALGRDEDGRVPGLLVRPGEPEALAAALRRWLEEPRRRQRLRRAAALRRLTLPSWSRTSTQLAAALETAREAGR